MALGSAPSACGALPAISTALAPRQHQRLVRLGGGRLFSRLRTAGGHAVALEQRANLLARLLGVAVTVRLLRDQRGHLLAQERTPGNAYVPSRDVRANAGDSVPSVRRRTRRTWPRRQPT